MNSSATSQQRPSTLSILPPPASAATKSRTPSPSRSTIRGYMWVVANRIKNVSTCHPPSDLQLPPGIPGELRIADENQIVQTIAIHIADAPPSLTAAHPNRKVTGRSDAIGITPWSIQGLSHRLGRKTSIDARIEDQRPIVQGPVSRLPPHHGWGNRDRRILNRWRGFPRWSNRLAACGQQRKREGGSGDATVHQMPPLGIPPKHSAPPTAVLRGLD